MFQSVWKILTCVLIFINLDSIIFSLLLAREVEELLYGNEEKYKGTTTMGISLLNDSNGKQAKPKPASYAPISNRYLIFFFLFASL